MEQSSTAKRGLRTAAGDLKKESKRPIVGDAGISLQLRTNLFLGTVEMGEKILQCLVQAGDIFVPEVFDGGKQTGGRKVKFDSQDLSLPLKEWVDDPYSLGIIAERQGPVESTLHVSATSFVMFDHLGLSVDSRWFTIAEHVDRFVGLARDLCGIIRPNSGYVQNWRSERVLGEITDEYGNLVGYSAPKVKWALKGIFWGNFFGPEYVEMFGRKKMMTAPCYKIEELQDGGVLLLLSKSPLEASEPEYLARKNELYAYLGQDAFTGKLMPTFRTEGRKKRDARPLVETGGIRDDVFS